MKTASARTGLSPHVIRVWEQRYKAVVPERTETNRRVYSEEQIERLRLLGMATRAGHSIRLIAGLSAEELQSLVANNVGSVKGSQPQLSNGDIETHICAALDAVRRLDSRALRAILGEAVLTFGAITFLQRIVHPLMWRIGEAWHAGRLRVAEEHMASATVRSFVGGLKDSQPAATSAAVEGWYSVYLGPDLPADEIAHAVRREKARAVALSITFPADDPRLGHELARLRAGLGDEVTLIAGGLSVEGYAPKLESLRARIVEDVKTFVGILRELRDRRST